MSVFYDINHTEFGEIVSLYLYSLNERKSILKPEVSEIFDVMYADFLSDEDLEYSFINILFSTIAKSGNISVSDLLKTPIGELAKFVLGNDYYEIFKIYLTIEERISTSCVLEIGVALRCKRALPHVSNIERAFKNLLILKASEWDDEEILRISYDSDEKDECGLFNANFEEWLTVKLAMNDEATIEFIANRLISAVMDDMNLSYLNVSNKSGNSRLLSLEKTILLYCDDDEIKELILRSIDRGTKESFLYMLNEVRKDNSLGEMLLRNIGINPFIPNSKQIDTIFQIAEICLKDKDKRVQMLDSSDALETYIAIWATGYENLDELWDVSNQYVKCENRNKIQASLLFYEKTWLVQAKHVLAMRALDKWKDDISMMAFIVPALLARIDMQKKGKRLERCPLDEFLCSKKDLKEIYNILKEFLKKMPPKFVVHQAVFPWHHQMLTRSHVIAKMASLAWYLNEQRLIDDVINYIEESECRGAFIKLCLNHPKGDKQVKFLIKSLKDKREDVKRWSREILISNGYITHKDY